MVAFWRSIFVAAGFAVFCTVNVEHCGRLGKMPFIRDVQQELDGPVGDIEKRIPGKRAISFMG